MYQPKLCISLLIMFIIGLHILPLVQKLPGGRPQTFWPIMAWGMYRHAHSSKQPIRTAITRTIGITLSGKAVAIGPEQIGLSMFAFNRIYRYPMQQGNAAIAQQLAERLNLQRDDPLVAFHLEGESYTLTASGVVKEALPVRVYRVRD
jgi:hypothetical protein